MTVNATSEGPYPARATAVTPGPSALPSQLHMIWPVARCATPPCVPVPAGYRLRQWAPADAAALIALHVAAGFKDWDRPRLDGVVASVLPGGFCVVEHVATRALVATTTAQRRPTPLHPDGIEIGWVSVDPAHRGRRLSAVTVAAALSCAIAAGGHRIYLQTDDWRLPALKVYLEMGFEPLLYAPDMEGRWSAIRRALEHGPQA